VKSADDRLALRDGEPGCVADRGEREGARRHPLTARAMTNRRDDRRLGDANAYGVAATLSIERKLHASTLASNGSQQSHVSLFAMRPPFTSTNCASRCAPPSARSDARSPLRTAGVGERGRDPPRAPRLFTPRMPLRSLCPTPRSRRCCPTRASSDFATWLGEPLGRRFTRASRVLAPHRRVQELRDRQLIGKGNSSRRRDLREVSRTWGGCTQAKPPGDRHPGPGRRARTPAPRTPVSGNH
jgi:hypothetical protein